MLLGAHISAAGGVSLVLPRAAELGCNTLQFFSRNPQRWRDRSLDVSQGSGFREAREETGISPVFIHSPYLINLASPEKGLFLASVDAVVEDIQDAFLLGADHIVIHMGSHKESGEDAGLSRLAAALNTIIKRTGDCPVGILLENSSGSGNCLGYEFAHLRRVLYSLEGPDRVGVCLDTAHAFAAGYDISSAGGLGRLIKEIDGKVGLKRLKLIHLNDSKSACGSRVDAHEHIGRGRIGMAGIGRIINHPALSGSPFILETPKDSPKADTLNLNTVRKLRRR
ncbi:MAG: deoxyribonuclease IV [Candidatus Omnitrophota bacterium]|jgi:deoxyribonuclease-4